jgi:GST-like protein
VRSRPAVISAYEKGQPWMNQPTITEESKKILFGQTAKNLEISPKN